MSDNTENNPFSVRYAHPDHQLALHELVDTADLPAPTGYVKNPWGSNSAPVAEWRRERITQWQRTEIIVNQRDDNDLIHVSLPKLGQNIQLNTDDVLALVAACVTPTANDIEATIEENLHSYPPNTVIMFNADDRDDALGLVVAVKDASWEHSPRAVWRTNTDHGALDETELARLILKFGGSFDDYGVLRH